jgi:hypothetical protein
MSSSQQPVNPCLSDALRYRDRGWSVIPICPHTKKPLIRWKVYQTRLPSEAEIRKWWKRFPNANVGIVTGAISSLLAVDLDGQAGIAYFKEMSRYFDLPPTAGYQTPRGGRRLLFQLPKGLHLKGHSWKDSKKKELVSFLLDGHYTLAPPSKLPDGDYAWQEGLGLGPDDVGIADAPDWLLALPPPHW